MNPSQPFVCEARRWLGTPYAHQGCLRQVGCDCLGLVRGVWKAVYGDEPEPVPAYSPGWAEDGRDDRLLAAARRHCREIAPEDLTGGDLLLFRWRRHLPAKHVAIATSPRTMIHAQDGACVCEIAISPWWRRHLAGVFRPPKVVE